MLIQLRTKPWKLSVSAGLASPFLISALDGGHWSISQPVQPLSFYGAFGTLWTGARWAPALVLTPWMIILLPLLGLENRPSVVWLVTVSTELKIKKNKKTIPVTGLGGLYVCQMLRIPHCLDRQLTDGAKFVSPTHRPHFTPQKHYFSVSSTHFC
jgi:hypothetical protein